MRTSARTRGVLGAVLVAVCLLLPTLSPLRASPPEAAGFYGGSALSTPFWVYVSSDAFADMPLVNVSVPYTTVSMDSAPSGAATATYLDTGQAVQLGASLAGQQQPQYASARYPGGPPESKATVVDQTDSTTHARLQAGFATAKASQDSVEAASVVAGFGVDYPASSGSSTVTAAAAPPDVAVLARTAFRSLARAVNSVRTAFGMRVFQADEASGTLGVGKLSTTSRMRGTGQKVVAETTALAEGIDLGGGVLRMSAVRSSAAVAVGGSSGQAEPSLEVAGASLGGIPVTFTADGVSVAGTALPAGPKDLTALSEQLNQAIIASGWKFRLLGAEKETKPGDATALARGIELRWDVPVPGGYGLPSLTFAVVMGRAEAHAYGRQGDLSVGAAADDARTEQLQGQANAGGGADSYQPGGAGSPEAGSAGSAPGDTMTVAGTEMRRVVTGRKGALLVALFCAWQLVGLAVVVEAMRLRSLPGKRRVVG
ncbi:MAG: hypothetical protein WDA71_03595 [Actinomycetota bacterium]